MLERLDAPTPQNDHVADVSLPARVYASPYAHRLLPAGPALSLAGWIGPAVRHRRNSAERRDGQRFMADLLLHTPRAAEADELAERWLVEKSKLGELFWRPWLLERSRLLGREQLGISHAHGVAAASSSPGTSAATGPCRRSSCGTDSSTMRSHIRITGSRCRLATGGWRSSTCAVTYLEKRLGGSRIILSDGPPERPLRLLEAGNSLLIAFDVAGSAATPFLGRSVALAGGPATLAFRTKSPVIPAIPQRQGTRIDLRFLSPINPADHEDPRSLRAAIAGAFEPEVLAHPESVELPWFPSPLVTETPPAEVPLVRSP